jgi:hypothetical protein
MEVSQISPKTQDRDISLLFPDVFDKLHAPLRALACRQKSLIQLFQVLTFIR